MTPTSGEVLIDGQPVGVATKKVVSFLPERTYLDSGLRVREVIQMFATFYEDFDCEKSEIQIFSFLLSFPARSKPLRRFALPKVGFRLRKRQFMTFSSLKMTRGCDA